MPNNKDRVCVVCKEQADQTCYLHDEPLHMCLRHAVIHNRLAHSEVINEH